VRLPSCDPGDVPGLAGPYKSDAGDDHESAPDVGREVQRVSLEGFASIFLCDVSQPAGARQINGQSDEENDDRRDAGLNMYGVEEEAVEAFVDDEKRGEKKEAGFDKRGKILEFAVAVGMALIGGGISDANREKGDYCGDEVETGMKGFREDA
jgi:hypothetical protein